MSSISETHEVISSATQFATGTILWANAYLQVTLRPKTKAPYIELVDWGGKVIRATETVFLPEYRPELSRWIRTKSPGAEFENGVELLSCSADYTLQFHLATDASISGIGGVLFQLVDTPAGAEAGPATRAKERIPMFLSFRLNNAETTYSNPERECLAVVRCLADFTNALSLSISWEDDNTNALKDIDNFQAILRLFNYPKEEEYVILVDTDKPG
ncbi:hypothetical protein F9C07_2214408 [Aspergillus flavus]|uniref:Reverse transcriptase RNase H-like domain-containing protein n=1 Tax=Aspergillus flavus (strain ATCC 200026 / FGSC A1120 / IAM 13836 / NRRL 3357 / JCM 12722 / SRRC 167) TaxID=332952 RepID=A0A7U2QU10_ASPFN|nr:hypothetical protein F9C07_2214408 [Aspergillus flavus]